MWIENFICERWIVYKFVPEKFRCASKNIRFFPFSPFCTKNSNLVVLGLQKVVRE